MPNTLPRIANDALGFIHWDLRALHILLPIPRRGHYMKPLKFLPDQGLESQRGHYDSAEMQKPCSPDVSYSTTTPWVSNLSQFLRLCFLPLVFELPSSKPKQPSWGISLSPSLTGLPAGSCELPPYSVSCNVTGALTMSYRMLVPNVGFPCAAFLFQLHPVMCQCCSIYPTTISNKLLPFK